MKTKRFDRLIKGGLAALAIFSAAQTAIADGRGYGPRRAEINAAVVVLSNQPDDPNIAPGADDSRDWYAFFALDSRTDLKPPGWEFLNPYAPADTGKRSARYWKVRLSQLSDNQLMRYNVLLLSAAPASFRMSLSDRDKLRRFVDAGGVLWVEIPAGWNRGQNIFFPDVRNTISAGGAAGIFAIDHPMLRGYYTLNPTEALNLGVIRTSAFTLSVSELIPVIGTSTNQNMLASGMYGSGRIVVSSIGIAQSLSQPFGSGPAALASAVKLVPPKDLKLIYNAVRWAGSTSTPSKDFRRSNHAFDRYGAPMANKWQAAGINPVATPTIHKGFVYIADGGRLMCFDGFPRRDADLDGSSDDGIPDLFRNPPIPGRTYDQVWEARLSGGQSSSPVVVQVARQQPGGQVTPEDLVIVVGDSDIRAYRAVPRLPNGRISPVGELAWTVNWGDFGGAPLSPARLPNGETVGALYADGLIMIPCESSSGGNNHAGMVAIWGPTGQTMYSFDRNQPGVPIPWVQPNPRSVVPVSTWKAHPAMGWVPNTSQGGGVDLVAYLPGEQQFGQGQTVTQPTVFAFWVGARGELLQQEAVGSGLFSTRLTRVSGADMFIINNQSNPGWELRPRVYAENRLTSTVVEVPDTALNFAQGNGRVQIDPTWDPAIYNLYIDYFLDWKAVVQTALFRTFMTLASASAAGQNPYANEIAGVTLAPDGTLFVASHATDATAPLSNGNVFAVEERFSDGRTSGTRVLWRWQAHGGYTQIVAGQVTGIPASLNWMDTSLPFFNQWINSGLMDFGEPGNNQDNDQMHVRFTHPPVYANGVLYLVGEGRVRFFGFPVGYSVLMALDANPNQFEIRLGAPITSPTGTILIRQLDYARGGRINGATNTISINPNGNDRRIELKMEGGVIRFKSFADYTQSRPDLMNNVLSLSQPVEVNISGQSYFIRPSDPQLSGTWNNLLWYVVSPTGTAQGPPVVMGDIVYTPMNNTFFDPGQGGITTFGGVTAMSANPKRELPNLTRGGQVPLIGVEAMLWPSLKDLPADAQNNPGAFLRELIVRFRNSSILGSNVRPLAFGDGLLMASGSEGMVAYEREFTLIADNGRIIELDTESTVAWAAENSELLTQLTGSTEAVVKTPIGSSARVYRINPNEMLVVDSTNDRVIVMDRSGNERRIIKSFVPDRAPIRAANGNIVNFATTRDANRPTGWVGGDSVTLRSPSDAATWTEFVPNANNPFAYKSPTGLEYWVHYLIADTGNFRIVDVVDRYAADATTRAVRGVLIDPSTNQEQLNMLNWVSPTSTDGKTYRYVGANRFQYGILNPGQANETPVWGFASLVQNYRAGGTAATPQDRQSPEEGMIILQINNADGTTSLNYCRRMRIRLPGQGVVERPLINPVSIAVSPNGLAGNVGNVQLFDIRVMFVDATGVYELTPNPNSETWDCVWAFTNEAYSNSVRRRYRTKLLHPSSAPIVFRAAQAKRLPNGNVLIVNSYAGSVLLAETNGPPTIAEFLGEVFEIDGRPTTMNFDDDDDPNDWTDSILGFSNSSIIWSSADRPGLSGSYQLRMPTSADRPF
ncbi:MAG: hypothetical protein HUU60_08070 [Armatimonadetes bacterium]|nr:hypothetical protein [Armatimonadota bacterium]